MIKLCLCMPVNKFPHLVALLVVKLYVIALSKDKDHTVSHAQFCHFQAAVLITNSAVCPMCITFQTSIL